MEHDKKTDIVAATEDRRAPLMDVQIDANLRLIYSERLSEPLPERLARILEQLRQQGRVRTHRPGVADTRDGAGRRPAPNLHVVGSIDAC